MYAPRNSIQLAVQRAPSPSGLVLPEGAVTFASVEIPSLAAKAFKAVFDLTDYDLRAPSLEFRSPWTNELLDYATMFRALEYEKDRKAHLVLLGDHPVTHRPFLCLRGIREYHEHPQHSGDDWLIYRRSMSLFSAVMSLWRVAVDLIRPLIHPGQGGVQVSWISDEKL